MKTNIVSIFLLSVIVLAACGKKDEATTSQLSPAKQVQGTWTGFPEVKASDKISINFEMKIDQDSVTSDVTCTADNEKVTVTCKASAQISDKTIKILEKVSRTTKQNGIKCSCSIDDKEVEYSMKDGKLILDPNDKNAITLTKKPVAN